MGRLVFGTLRDAWKDEAADFTPLLAQQVGDIGNAIGVELGSIGSIEVSSAGRRRIDILADGNNGAIFVIDNQYGVLNHDHLTRGLAYAVASHARGLIVIAEEHRDEFRAAANYLNELRDNDPERGVAVWLVEANAVRIGESPWAHLFQTVVSPNSFTAAVEFGRSSSRRRLARGDFEAAFESEDGLKIARQILDWRTGPDRRYRIMANPVQVVLESRGQDGGGWRSVIGVYPNGQVAIPFGSYNGLSSGIGVDVLSTDEFRTKANAFFGLKGGEVQARTSTGWLTMERSDELKRFCSKVADAYLKAKPELHFGSQQNASTLEHTFIEVPGPMLVGGQRSMISHSLTTRTTEMVTSTPWRGSMSRCDIRGTMTRLSPTISKSAEPFCSLSSEAFETLILNLKATTIASFEQFLEGFVISVAAKSSALQMSYRKLRRQP